MLIIDLKKGNEYHIPELGIYLTLLEKKPVKIGIDRSLPIAETKLAEKWVDKHVRTRKIK